MRSCVSQSVVGPHVLEDNIRVRTQWQQDHSAPKISSWPTQDQKHLVSLLGWPPVVCIVSVDRVVCDETDSYGKIA